jgi:aspartyl protease family protein
MLKFVVVVGVAAVSAALAAQTVMDMGRHEAQAAPMAAVASLRSDRGEPEQPAAGQPASIAKAADGHYWAEAKVNGTRVRFLVDTGATAVALSMADATRLGIDPVRLEYTHKVTTASGEARAARVTLDSVSVAGARIDDVEAYVIESGLETSLLGMTYLGRLQRFEATRTALILRP